jgi:anti-sigma factor RsiW
MLSCKELTELVTDYLEGRMPFLQRVKFHLHLGTCDRCRAYLRQMKMAITTLGRLPDEPAPAGVREELLARFRDMRPASPAAVAARRRSFIAVIDEWLRPRGWMVVGLVLFAAALLGVLLDGEHGPVFGDTWAMCLLMEVGAALPPVVVLGFAAVRMRERISAGALAAIAAGGALAGDLSLPLACPYSRVASHVLVVHTGGILLAALIAAGASRLPALARR